MVPRKLYSKYVEMYGKKQGIFPEAIARNEEEGNGPFVPLQSCKVKNYA